MNDFPKVSIIIPNLNSRNDLRKCLEALGRLDYPDFEVIVADGGSTDGSVEMIRTEFPSTLLISKPGMGIGEANNEGFKISTGRLLFFDLNSDEIVKVGWLKNLVNALIQSDREIIVCGKRFLTDGRIDSAGAKISYLTGSLSAYGRKRIDNRNYWNKRVVDYGPALLMKRETFERVGKFDECYFIYFEDSDFCLRAKKLGIRTLYVPNAISIHKLSSSVGSNAARQHYYLRRNWTRFILKQFPMPYMLSAFLLHGILFTILDLLMFCITQRSKMAYAEIQSLVWNIKNFRDTNVARQLLENYSQVKLRN